MRRKFFIYFLIANLYFLSGNIPLIISYLRTPNNTVFPFIHSENPYDYNVYLAVITEGQNGFWLFKDPFTSENTKPGIFYLYYIFLGRITSLFSLWPPVVYHLARILSVEMFIISLFLLCTKILGLSSGFWAALLSIAATIPPLPVFGEPQAFRAFYPWWANLEAVKRLDGLPHHIFGQAMFLFSLFFIISYSKSLNLKHYFLSLVSILIAGIVLPPVLFPAILAAPCTLAIMVFHHLIKNTKYKISFKTVYPYFLYWICALFPLFLSWWQTRQGYPWILWLTWEIAQWNKEPNFNRHLFISFGLLPLLTLPGLIDIIKKNDKLQLFIFIWAILPLLLLFLIPLLNIGKIRLIFAVPFVPWAILSVISLKLIALRFKNKNIFHLLILVFIIVNLSISISYFYPAVKRHLNSEFYSNIYVSNRVWRAIDFMNKNLPPKSIILSNEYVGNLIPAFTPLISYFGHINQTLDFAQKQKNTWLFYTNSLSDNLSLKFLNENNISYIYYSDDEKLGGESELSYGYLKEIYNNDSIRIYSYENKNK